ncbi:LysR family transcriptional regulator [Kiloniella sp. b19]|uniref:LysR family transcriptional regulator n=1 Tax=Kiloniella sp. GXU_MW_B19 TaxID=3141326 RepID=UPI0031D3E368
MDWNDVEVFIAVVEEGSFTAAAEQMRQSKSAVSKQVSRLEDNLGIRLLNRTTRKLSLTEAGEIFFNKSRLALDAMEDARHDIHNLTNSPRGLLRINAPMSFSTLWMPDIIAEFMRLYPDIEIDFVMNDQIVDLIEDGFDVGLRISDLQDSRLIARRLKTIKMVLIAAPSLLEKYGVPKHPGELAKIPFVNYRYDSRKILEFFGAQGKVSVQVRSQLTVNNDNFALSAVARGLGFAFLPTFSAMDALVSGRVVPILQDWSLGHDISLYSVYPINRNLAPKVRVFLDFIVKNQAMMDWDKAIEERFDKLGS